MLADYDRLANQPELVQHLASIRLIATLINDTLSEYDAGGGRDAWKAVEAAHRKFSIAKRSGDRVKLAEGVAELELAIEHGVGRQSRRDEIKGLVDQHRKLVDSETKRYLIEAETYSVEQMTASMQAIGVIAGRFVPEDVKEQFFQEYTEYLGARLYHRHPEAAGAEGAEGASPDTEEIENAEIVGEEPGVPAEGGEPAEVGRAG